MRTVVNNLSRTRLDSYEICVSAESMHRDTGGIMTRLPAYATAALYITSFLGFRTSKDITELLGCLPTRDFSAPMLSFMCNGTYKNRLFIFFILFHSVGKSNSSVVGKQNVGQLSLNNSDQKPYMIRSNGFISKNVNG